METVRHDEISRFFSYWSWRVENKVLQLVACTQNDRFLQLRYELIRHHLDDTP